MFTLESLGLSEVQLSGGGKSIWFAQRALGAGLLGVPLIWGLVAFDHGTTLCEDAD